MTPTTRLGCACGQVALQTQGRPIVSVECCCASCREAGARIQALAGAPACATSAGATPFVLYRKDRVRLLEGADRLKAFRLKPASPTRRVVAACCNTPVFLEFDKGHWLSLYGCLWPEPTRPAAEMRTMTGDLPADARPSDEIPGGRGASVAFFARLLGAWIAMGLRTPKIDFVKGELDA